MYSARAVNHTAYFSSTKTFDISETLFARESDVPGLGGVFTSREPDFALADRTAWLFISIKNRSFNRPYVNQFIDLCEAMGLEGRICAVDAPYLFNAMAELGLDTLPDAEAQKIEGLSSDMQRMAAKAIRGKRTTRVSLVDWSDLEARTPQIYKDELSQAFRTGTQVRDLLFDHVTSVKIISDERQFERFAAFFLCEVPVLIHAYYAEGATLDIYPGPQPAFFWMIELGAVAEDLPHLTALTRSGRPMLFLDTHHRRRPRT